jgi:hypothetical protein
MKQAGGWQVRGPDAIAGMEARAAVTRTTAINNNPILFFIGGSFQVWDAKFYSIIAA